MNSTLPTRARVIVIGGGIAGTSVAWHLTQLGWSDVLLLEQNRLAGGTTWHAAGMVTCWRASGTMARINRASAELYARLGVLTGHDAGWRPVGSLYLARTSHRMVQYHRTAGAARYLGVESHVLSPEECGRRFPGMRTEDLIGGYWIPGDGRCLPAEVPVALARGIRAAGGRVIEGVRVTSLRHDGRRVTGVVASPQGAEIEGRQEIEAEAVVVCGGMWSRQLAEAADVSVPVVPVEHHYLVSHRMAGVTGDLPCTRDLDGSIYFRGEDVPGGGVVVLGAFQRRTKVWEVPRVPDDFSFRLLEPDWDRFAEPMAEGLHRLPVLRDAGFDRFVNGPESFTPDNRWLMGETAELAGLFVLTGFNSSGIAAGGGAGKALAEWIVGGSMPFDLTAVDVRRWGGWANQPSFLRDRATEVVGLHYQMAWPNREFETGRSIRRSPLHERLAAAGASFGSIGGWERPNWFARSGAAEGDGSGACATTPEVRYGFGRQNWFANHAFEHRAVRERVALVDRTSEGRLVVRGSQAFAVMQRISASDLAGPPGRAVRTAFLNEQGGYEAEVVVVRSAPNEFLVITGSSEEVRVAAWIRSRFSSDADCEVEDVTGRHGAIGVMGPRSRELLARVTPEDVSPAAFPYGAHRSIPIAGVRVDAVRMTHVGESGWDLWVSPADLGRVYEVLWQAGDDLGVANVGHYAVHSLGLEKGHRSFGAELSPDVNPLEAGLSRSLAWEKPGGFVGLDALVRRRSNGLRRLLAGFVLEDPGPVLWGGEPILRDEVAVGQTTSGSYGHTLRGGIGLGYVKDPRGGFVTRESVAAGRYEVLVNGSRFAARVYLDAPYDPGRKRLAD